MHSWKVLSGLVLLFSMLIVRPVSAGSVEILYSGCSNAHFENCHCPNDPYGAMEKRSAEVSRRRELGPVILLDSGDYMPALVDTLTARFVVEAMALMEYDAVGIGDQELMQGPEILRLIREKLPLVSANVVFEDSSEIAPPLKIIQRGGETWAVTALLHPDALKFVDSELVEHVKVLNPHGALETVKQEVPEGARFIVLTHFGEEKDRLAAQAWTGVDLIVGGHSQSRIEGVTDTPIPVVQAGGNARYLGSAVFRGPKVRAELVPMKQELPDDSRILQLLMQLKDARRSQKKQ